MTWFLIENNAQVMYRFRTLRELRAFAKAHGLEVKRSPTDPSTFYTESYVYLPLGFED